jgi:hypothetical protein
MSRDNLKRKLLETNNRNKKHRKNTSLDQSNTQFDYSFLDEVQTHSKKDVNQLNSNGLLNPIENFDFSFLDDVLTGYFQNLGLN